MDKLRRNPVMMERFPEFRLLEVEFFIQAKDFKPAGELLNDLVKDEPRLPPWINRQVGELKKILIP
jgi:hypothetical protein